MRVIEEPLAVVGGGTMAQAIIQGGDAAGVLSPGMVVVAEPDQSKHAALRALGVEVVPTAAEALSWLMQREVGGVKGQVLLAVKPQSLAEIGREILPLLRTVGRRVVISILAGTPTQRVRSVLGDVAVVRAMPNTPARIRQGVTAIALGEGATQEDASLAQTLFSGVGPLVVPIDESLMDAFTAIAGSGPAYVFYLAQAMVDAAEAMGFNRPTALKMVQGTVAGSGILLAESAEEPAVLLAGVKSKGGTTEAALKVLESERVMSVIVRAITAARDRGTELSR